MHIKLEDLLLQTKFYGLEKSKKKTGWKEKKEIGNTEKTKRRDVVTSLCVVN